MEDRRERERKHKGLPPIRSETLSGQWKCLHEQSLKLLSYIMYLPYLVYLPLNDCFHTDLNSCTYLLAYLFITL